MSNEVCLDSEYTTCKGLLHVRTEESRELNRDSVRAKFAHTVANGKR